MILREIKDRDLDKIRRIHENFHDEDFPFPQRMNFLSEAVAEDNGEIVAYGLTKILAEPIMILDISKTSREKCEAFKLLIERCIQDAKEAHLEQLYISVSNPTFAEILSKHFGFIDVRSKSMVLNLE